MTTETEPGPEPATGPASAAKRRKGPLIAAAVVAGLGALAAVYGAPRSTSPAGSSR
jgi:hypothetical protein